VIGVTADTPVAGATVGTAGTGVLVVGAVVGCAFGVVLAPPHAARSAIAALAAIPLRMTRRCIGNEREESITVLPLPSDMPTDTNLP